MDTFLLDDGSCPACGSVDVDVDTTPSPNPAPVVCRSCGWKGWVD